MTKTFARGAIAATVLSLAAATSLAGCAGSSPEIVPAATTTSPAVQPEEGQAAAGETYGCTPEVLAYLEENGFPEPEPLDPATISIPESSFAVVPDCYVVDQYGGFPRYSATWSTEISGVTAELGAALAAGGWVQSDEYGPLVWWFNGDGPSGAEHALGAAPQEIDGVETLWASW